MTRLGTEGLGTDPRQVALQELAGLLRGQKYDVTVETLQLTVRNGDGPPVEVWALRRPDDDYQVWFAWPERRWICEARHPHDAVVHIKKALHCVPDGDGGADPTDAEALIRRDLGHSADGRHGASRAISS
ncbi:hypothetical protein [Thermomonospora cellulosilytica]|uniref:Uncharacterized protein n=1 Tax=Thermomonospora cellulosilytica TaxID=1411118 RepID=A0A7W3MVX8_9ACTN|nr:hypothetical protein [Thermomonospora cellulosilytica]MBA9002824.1 hypothetical protein [Thermomonospora cellulosilytica]